MANLPIYPTTPGPSQGDYSAFDGTSPLPRGDPSGLPIPSPDQDLTAGTLPQRPMPAATPPMEAGFGMEVINSALNAAGLPSVDLSPPSPGDPNRMGLNPVIPAQEPGRFGTNQRA